MTDYSVLHNVQSVGPSSFGLGQVALNLAIEQNRLGCDAIIWCIDSADDIRWASRSSGLSESKIVGFSITGPRKLWFTPRMVRAAEGHKGKAFNIVHQHGLWTGVSRATERLHRKYGIPSVIAPHGSLNDWALQLSKFKKKIALAAYEGANLHSASCLHATNEAEVTDFRNFGLTNPIAVIRNGISKEWSQSEGEAKKFRSEHGIPLECRILFFLSRITPKKGLPMLIEAIKAVEIDFNEWILIIAGTDEFGHKKDIETLIKKLDLSEKIRVIGPLFGQAKRDAFSAADLFILPSHSEGSPIVILDSLAVGVPVITTKASQWEDLNTYGCGWWIDIRPDVVCDTLRHAISLSREQLMEMGKRGRNLVASKYTWAITARQTLELYDWLMDRREKPQFVLLA